MSEMTRSFFEMSVEEYEAHVLSHAGLEDEVYKETAKALGLKGASLLLDLWCSEGRALDEIMKLSPWISVTGLDRSPALLAKLLAKPYASRLTLVNCPHLATPFGNATYDAAVTAMTMHHFTGNDRLTIYKKIFEALRPGGRYVEADLTPSADEKNEMLLREAGFSSVETRWKKNGKAIYVAGKEPNK